MKEIIEIIDTIETSKANVNPTQIYNEGWMTRLLVYYSIEEKIKLKNIDFLSGRNWTSEALLSSPFVKVPKIREGYTHADIAYGDFTVDYEETGKIIVNPNAEIFGVIEAKMGSPLSNSTKNAPDYNQASRTVACIAENTNENCKTFYYVVLPETKSKKSISDLVTNKEIKKQIKERFEFHNKKNDLKLNENVILSKVEKCDVGIITYEDWIKLFTDKEINKTLNDFYNKCKKWNNIKGVNTIENN